MLTSAVRQRVFSIRLGFSCPMSLESHNLPLMVHNVFISKATTSTSVCCIMENTIRRWYSNSKQVRLFQDSLMGGPVQMCTKLNAEKLAAIEHSIKTELDPEFDINEILDTSIKCFEIVNEAIVIGKYNVLKDLVQMSFMVTLRDKLDALGLEERNLLYLKFENVQTHYIYSLLKNQISQDQAEVSISTVFESTMLHWHDKRVNYRGTYTFTRVYKNHVPKPWKVSYFNVHYFQHSS